MLVTGLCLKLMHVIILEYKRNNILILKEKLVKCNIYGLLIKFVQCNQ